MIEAITQQRQTKYCDAIESALADTGHATNSELLQVLGKIFPGLSATTIHRATARLASRGVIGVAPSTRNGSIRYDGNIIPHDHFICTSCDKIRDTDVVDKVVPIIEKSIDGCSISGRLSISGICNKCKEKRG